MSRLPTASSSPVSADSWNTIYCHRPTFLVPPLSLYHGPFHLHLATRFFVQIDTDVEPSQSNFAVAASLIDLDEIREVSTVVAVAVIQQALKENLGAATGHSSPRNLAVLTRMLLKFLLYSVGF